MSHLELLKLPYTGCNPRGLLLARDKSLSKKLLAYHRIRVPEFEVFRAGRPIRRPKRLAFPLMVKSLTQEASIGISQASVVDSDEKLKERVAFIHESIGTAAIVEQYIEGRELYVGILGNQTLQALPVWELFFTNMPEGSKRIATDRVKWSVKYQKKYGIDSGMAPDLAEGQAEGIQHLCKRAYRALELSGYARIDLRLDEAGNVWVLEANPNPQIARGEDFADSAEKIGTQLRNGAAADHQPRAAVAAGECGVAGGWGLGWIGRSGSGIRIRRLGIGRRSSRPGGRARRAAPRPRRRTPRTRSAAAGSAARRAPRRRRPRCR